MKLQIAIDTADMEKVLGMVEKIHDVIDIVEVGTPVIMQNEKVHFVSHPDDDHTPLDYERLVKAAKESQVALEVNNSSLLKPDQRLNCVENYQVMSGLVSIAAGFLVRYSGKNAVEKLLPATITGSISMIIGLTLAGNALTDAAPSAAATGILSSSWVWVVSLVTLLSTILFSRYLKGFLGQLPLLLGAGVGCLMAAILYFTGIGNMIVLSCSCVMY